MYQNYVELKNQMEQVKAEKEELARAFKAKEIDLGLEEYYAQMQDLQLKENQSKASVEEYRKEHKLEISREMLKSYFGYELNPEYIKSIRPDGMAMQVDVKEEKSIKQLDNEIFSCLKRAREMFQKHEIDEFTYTEILSAVATVKKDIYQTLGVKDETKEANASMQHSGGPSLPLVLGLILLIVVIGVCWFLLF
ncbi:MAG TPA: hypothetical protein IAD49_01210 [Candidatus Fimihabitans intestinipullorum]|uniref:Uncharacterized protein n=1 Tax=Candidatus Fimihabitans intestinipullorum TaxID=2840820 RepID=A0A9D1L3N2_9BACT|nr:hypothetical protein [Candidatus Fimihabitans intestinipullorum]